MISAGALIAIVMLQEVSTSISAAFGALVALFTVVVAEMFA